MGSTGRSSPPMPLHPWLARQQRPSRTRSPQGWTCRPPEPNNKPEGATAAAGVDGGDDQRSDLGEYTRVIPKVSLLIGVVATCSNRMARTVATQLAAT